MQVPFEKVILRGIKIPVLGSLWSDVTKVKSLPQKNGHLLLMLLYAVLTPSLFEKLRHSENVRPRSPLATQTPREGVAPGSFTLEIKYCPSRSARSRVSVLFLKVAVKGQCDSVTV